MKQCRVCKQEKSLDEFYSSKGRKDGKATLCKLCDKAAVKARRERTREIRIQYSKDYWHKKKDELNANRREKRKAMTEDERRVLAEKQRAAHRAWYVKNKETKLQQNKEWASDNKDKTAYYAAKHRAAKLQATVQWTDEQYVSDLYSNTTEANAIFKDYGIVFEVDHIIPLQGKHVCGLHVENNLQILSQTENRTKSNYYEVL